MTESHIPAISVIIPVYNAEKHLVECLDSVCNQTLKDIEIICVNDGSTDSSPLILAKYAKDDSRIQLITQQNSGPGCARNRGISVAQGEYLAFIDSDDYWDPELLEKVYSKIKADDSDICLYPYNIFNQNTGKMTPISHIGWLPRKQPFSPDHYSNRIFQMSPAGPGFRLYKRQLILQNKLEFLTQNLAEDLYFVCLAMVFAKRICYINDFLYIVRRGITENISSSLAKFPRETHYSLLMIKQRLEAAHLYEPYRSSFRITAISCSEYIFWHVPPEILPKQEREHMLAELDIADKPFITEYHGNDTISEGRFQLLKRMYNNYGIDYTYRFLMQTICSYLHIE